MTERYTLRYVCSRVGISSRTLRRYVSEGLVSPCEPECGRASLFDRNALERLEIIRRLREDLGVNLAGIDIILRLLERIDDLESERRNETAGRADEAERAAGDEASPRVIGREIFHVEVTEEA